MTTATDMLTKYLAAEQAILEGKEARIGDRWLHREDLSAVIKGRKEWEQRVSAENRYASGNVPTIGGIRFSVARLDR